MLQHNDAANLYNEIKGKASACQMEGFDEFYRGFLQAAMDYAKNRAAWALMSQSERNEDDKSRRMAHDAFISRLSGVCRTLELSQPMEELLPDRKAKGDFACYIAMFLALEQR